MSRVQSGCDGFSSRIDRFYMRIERFKDVSNIRINLAHITSVGGFYKLFFSVRGFPRLIFTLT
jgi:hypothetical protein